VEKYETYPVLYGQIEKNAPLVPLPQPVSCRKINLFPNDRHTGGYTRVVSKETFIF
jgi:hypothetical protein